MPRGGLWNAPPGQPCKETAARAALISLKKLSRSTARAQRPLPLAHAEVRDHADAVKRRLELAPHVRGGAQALARRCVCLCTRGTRRCARTDKNGAIRPILCPTLHTTKGGVCTNGLVVARIGLRVSDFAHACACRVHKRTITASFLSACERGRSGRVRIRTSRCRHRPSGGMASEQPMLGLRWHIEQRLSAQRASGAGPDK